MSAPTRLAAYAAVLAIVVAGGAGIGAAAGPIDVGGDDEPGHVTHADDAAAPAVAAAPADPGTQVDLPPPSPHAAVDGYDVELAGDPRPGESELAFTVSQGGTPVRTEPYLGAAGHLVVIRAADIAYLHVHPVEGEGDEVRFAADLPSPGRYRLFLDFSHGGAVHTAAFTVDVPDAGTTATADPTADAEHGSH